MKIGYLVCNIGKSLTQVSYLTHFFSVILVEANFETGANGYFYTWLGL